MANQLARLLETGSIERTVAEYESTFDDFIAFAGGRRIEGNFDVPPNSLNADYLVETEAAELVIELKQVNKYRKANSVDQYFEALLHQGKVRNPTALSTTQMRIEPRSLTTADWNHFYRKFRPNVGEHLDKAAQQLKATAAFLPPTNRHRRHGVIMVNTGDFNLPVDLLHRLVEFHTKRKWKAGRYSYLDFVMCITMDMVKTGQNPLHGRGIVRSAQDAQLVEGVRYLYDRWVHYAAAAVGAEVEFHPDANAADPPLQLSGGIEGKIRKVA